MWGAGMTQTRLDLPWNFPADWDEPKFMDGEIPALAMEEGARIIGTQRVLVECGMNAKPVGKMVKTGIAIYRLGWIFEEYRPEIVEAIKRARAARREDGERQI